MLLYSWAHSTRHSTLHSRYKAMGVALESTGLAFARYIIRFIILYNRFIKRQAQVARSRYINHVQVARSRYIKRQAQVASSRYINHTQVACSRCLTMTLILNPALTGIMNLTLLRPLTMNLTVPRPLTMNLTLTLTLHTYQEGRSSTPVNGQRIWVTTRLLSLSRPLSWTAATPGAIGGT